MPTIGNLHPIPPLPDNRSDRSAVNRPLPNQSARSGMRVLLALATLGPRQEHQVADVARVAELRPQNASRMLIAAVQEGLVMHGTRYGAYRLTKKFLNAQVSARSSTPRIQQTVQALHDETGLAIAYHEPGWRPGTGMYLELVELLCPEPEHYEMAAQQHGDLRHTAAGRAALSFISGHVACDAEGQRLRLEPRLLESITTTRVAASRTVDGQALATPVLRGDAVIATLTASGSRALFQDPLAVQEYAVLLRRAAMRTACVPARASMGSVLRGAESFTRQTA
ncbi:MULTISPECIES: hypothetical protein [Streptomyces]|uniref:hypothetical protein n=1 Tax=Streptomyces TaxID=1883 RepID=UPI002F90C0EC